MGERVTDFLVVGRWSQCAHCGGIYAGEHYCGAPWQQRAADCPAEWQPFVWDGKALLTRVSGEPPRTVGDTGDGGER